MLDTMFNDPLHQLDSIKEQAKKIDSQNKELKRKLETPYSEWNNLSPVQELQREAMEEDNN